MKHGFQGSKLRIIHISDTHIGSKKHFNKENLEKVIHEANSGRYDLLIHSGDITQGSRVSEYQKIQTYLEQLSIPHILIPGNHDKRSGGLSLFEKFIGPPNGVKVFDDAVVVFVDSGVPDSNLGRVGMIKFDHINEALKTYEEKDIKIVALHHHVVPVPHAGRERHVLSNAGDLLDLFLKTDVDIVISGHRHVSNIYHIEKIVFVNAGTVSSTKTRHGDINSYNIIEIGKEEVTIEIRRVNNSNHKNTYARGEKRVFYDFGKREFRIVHMANSYISQSKKFLPRHFFNAVKHINDQNPDLVVHCGGIVEEGIPRNYKLAKEYLAHLNVPIVFTPAGRDLNYLGYQLFQEYFGKIDQSFSNHNLFLQGLSSAQYDSPIGIVGEKEREALFEKFQQRDEPFQGLFIHHNVLPIPHSREKGLLEDAGDLLRKAVDEKIDLILTGTSSYPFAAKIGTTVVANANALSSVYQRSIYGNSFNLIDIYEEHIVVSEINSLWGTQRILGVWEIHSG